MTVTTTEGTRTDSPTIENLPQELTLRIHGMDCADCATKLEKGVGQLPGVTACEVSFATAKIRLIYDPTTVGLADVEKRVRAMGYAATTDAAGFATTGDGLGPWRRHLLERPQDASTALAGGLIALALVSSLAGLPEAATTTLYALAVVSGGYFVARKAISSVRINRELDINVLMSLAVAGAVAIGEWPEAALVVFLFSLGESLEGYTMSRARTAIRSLMTLAPAEATILQPCLDCEGHMGSTGQDGAVYRGGPCPWCEPHERRVAVEELAPGDTLLVRPGERIPMDGLVLGGSSAVNQAPITGESLPVDKGPGDEVFAGTVNGNGVLTMQVTHLAADNTISRLVAMVEDAQSRKAPTQRWVDGFARVYTPVVLGIALLVAIVPPLLLGEPFLDGPGGPGWLYRALTLLVIACPCALVISTPVSIVSAISAGARNGVLIKGGTFLEAMAKLRVLALDKTGTLTLGRPTLTTTLCSVHADNGREDCWQCDDVLALAASLERRSEHPLGNAVVRAATERLLADRYATAAEVQALAGRGLQGLVDGQLISVTSHRYAHEQDLCSSTAFCREVTAAEEAGQTTMLVRDGQGVRGFLAVSDQIRPESAQAVEGLKRTGIQRVIMLTGDTMATALAIAGQAGIDEARANLMPEDKVEAIEDLLEQYGGVAMVGDGVNDAPALARATVGIAMGGAGSDQALETADVALMGDDLRLLPFLVHLSRSTRRVIAQNVTFSLVVKAVFLGLAVAGLATLWMAVFADVGASLIVILNGMRLLRARPRLGSGKAPPSESAPGRR